MTRNLPLLKGGHLFFFFKSFILFCFFKVDNSLKSLLNSLQYCFYFMFSFFGHKAYGILAHWPGSKPTTLHWEEKSQPLECQERPKRGQTVSSQLSLILSPSYYQQKSFFFSLQLPPWLSFKSLKNFPSLLAYDSLYIFEDIFFFLNFFLTRQICHFLQIILLLT